jgi:hypothetical protein
MADPRVRARLLDVILLAKDHFIVPDGTGTHTVLVHDGTVSCTCAAGRNGQHCAHRQAVINHLIGAQRMRVSSTVVTGDGDFPREQPVRIGAGMYGAMFARYTEPKMYQKYNSQEEEEKFYVSFVITHDAAANPLPRFTEAFAGMRTKRFWDKKTGKQSTLFNFYCALLHGKFTPEQIIAWQTGEEPDLDEYIGFPIRLLIRPAQAPDKNGIYQNKINTEAGGFYEADGNLRKAIKPLFLARKVGVAENGIEFLTEPKAEFDPIGTQPAVQEGDGFGTSDAANFDEDITF